MSRLDDDTALLRSAPGHWRGEIGDGWTVVGPNGGYLATFILRALMAESPHPDPLTLTVHFLTRAEPGPATVEVDVLREGRSHATLSARLVQDGLVALALASFGRRRPGAVRHSVLTMPAVAPPDECLRRRGPIRPGSTIADRFDRRLPPGGHPDLGGPGDGSPVAGGWMRLLDRELDDLAVPLFCDAWPASIWAATGRAAGAPTIELTVHWWARPTCEWHLGWFRSPWLAGGYFAEEGELWGQDGELVAQSRQLARYVEGEVR